MSAADEPASTPGAPHELQAFMQEVSNEMSAEYERIAARAPEDPGTAGDEGEENWADLLRQWLPEEYKVVTKGRILAESGEASPQLDVLVLAPGYPPKLRTKKMYLAAGVVAAFECKLTLRVGHIGAAVRTAAAIRRMLPTRDGSPYRELHSPLTFGLLAHAHEWRRPGAEPLINVERTLWEADLADVAHPREMLDVLCVANLATWRSQRMAFVGPSMLSPWSSELARLYGQAGCSTSSYMGPHPSEPTATTPIGVLFAGLLLRVAWEDSSLRPLADYWRRTEMFGPGQGKMRQWEVDAIYTEGVAPRVRAGGLANGVPWDEWSVGFL